MKLLILIMLTQLFFLSCEKNTSFEAQNRQQTYLLPVRIDGPPRLQDFYAALENEDYAFMWNMIAQPPESDGREAQCELYPMLEFPGKAVGGTFWGRDKILDRFIGLQKLVNGTLKFKYRWVGTSKVSEDREILEFHTTSEVPIEGVNHPYFNRGAVIVTFNKDNKIIAIHDYLDTEELGLVGQSDNRENLHELIQQARKKAGLSESVYPPCPDKPYSLQ